MNILYCGDKKICDGLLMSVVSLLRVVPEEIHIYVLTQSPTKRFEKFADYLDSYVKGVNNNNSLCLIDITLHFQSCLPEANMDTRFTPACMFRLYADLVPELPDRLLYLDYDVICLKDPTAFYNQSIDGIEYVGCLDYYGKWYYTPLRHNYCNSGVLLMNLAEMKRTGLLRKCREECRDKKMFLPDQHALNHNVTARRIETNRFNDQRRTHPDTVFRHFSTTWRVFPYPHTVSIKPWNEQGMRETLRETRFDSIFEEYKRIKNKILKTMNHIKEEIPVFFTIDDNYTPWLAVAINSLIINASPKYDYRIIVLHQGLKDENIQRIASLAKPGYVIEFIPMREKFEGITDDFMGNKLRADYFTLTIYFRLFIPTMFPQYDKGIYLDSDIVVSGDISELYNTNLGKNLIGACPDFSIQEIPDFVNYVTRYIGCARSIEYINSGILLMNLKALREKRLGTRFLELLNQYHFDCIAPDQDYINALCMGKILFLSEEWDAMPNDSKPELEAPKIIHYNLFAKPWCYDGIQYDKQFWQYATSSGYIDDIILFKRNYSDEQKASDTACAQGLVKRAAMLAVKEHNTFAMIFGNGQEERL